MQLQTDNQTMFRMLEAVFSISLMSIQVEAW